MPTIDEPWQRIFEHHKINEHDFSLEPFEISAAQIKEAVRGFQQVGQREVRILCKQDSRENRPKVFKDQNLFILPIKNGHYAIVQGEGYFDIPEIGETIVDYESKVPFALDTSFVGDSEMQHVDYAYATSLIRTFLNDATLVLTVRGRKYTPKFTFTINNFNITVESVQTEVDAGYEGRNKLVLIEAKRAGQANTIIRQLYYPFRQWKSHTKKEVVPVFFEKSQEYYSIWQFGFSDENDYNSIHLVRSSRFAIKEYGLHS